MNHIFAFLIAPTVTTAIVAIAYGVITASPLGAIGMAMIFGIFCFFFTILIGIPGHVLFCLLKVKSALAYALFGFLAGTGIVQFLAGGALAGTGFSSEILFGILGMLNAVAFAVALKKLSAEQGTDGNPPEAAQPPH